MTERLTLRFQKFDQSDHWVFPGLRLGTDDFGFWAGIPVGTVLEKHSEPRRTHVVDAGWVACFPRDGGYVFRSYARPNDCDVYVDIALAANEDAGTIRVVDMDLDVIRFRESGAVEVLDEDEFEVHRERFGYPSDVVTDCYRWMEHWRAELGSRDLGIVHAALGWHRVMNDLLHMTP